MIQKLNEKRNEKGFTLIELMIVIAIIGILSAIAIPNFLSYRDKGIESAVQSEAKAFYSAAVAYLADTGHTGLVDETLLTDAEVYDAADNMTVTGGLTLGAGGTITSTATFDLKNKRGTLDEFGNVVVGATP